MTFIAIPRARHLPLLSALGDSVRRVRSRHSLTPQERHNMHVTNTLAADFTACLADHLAYR
jgi:hypothetical protein